MSDIEGQRIKDLATTATSEDLEKQNYIAIDGEEGTKKLPIGVLKEKIDDKVSEAPADTKEYVRKNKQWVELESGKQQIIVAGQVTERDLISLLTSGRAILLSKEMPYAEDYNTFYQITSQKLVQDGLEVKFGRVENETIYTATCVVPVVNPSTNIVQFNFEEKSDRIYNLPDGSWTEDAFVAIDRGESVESLERLPLSEIRGIPGKDGESPIVEMRLTPATASRAAGLEIKTIDAQHKQGQIIQIADDIIKVDKENSNFDLSIHNNSIGKKKLKNPTIFIPDSNYLKFLNFKDSRGSFQVITLNDKLKTFLEDLGYAPD